MMIPPIGFALVLTVLGAVSPPQSSPTDGAPGSCRRCHEHIVERYLLTAHFRTSAEATARTIKGSFVAGQNVLLTGNPSVKFQMTHSMGRFLQTGVDVAHGSAKSEGFDLVIGSGRKGQTYLYRKNGLLFELPVSYLTALRGWINSPGFRDGTIDFGRLIQPRCLECHSTEFSLVDQGGSLRYAQSYQLGLSCAKCHGDGSRHIAYHSSHRTEKPGKFIFNAGRAPRDAKLDNCALCHSGGRQPRKPAFTYRPGARVDDYYAPPSPQESPAPDVHGNQIGLLRLSKCFRSSPSMSCTTCHDVHQTQREPAPFAQKCLVCHQGVQHKMAARLGSRLLSRCIDCHMPNEPSRALVINTPNGSFGPAYRSHRIGLYPQIADKVLQGLPARGRPAEVPARRP